MFEGFRLAMVDTGEAVVRVRQGGSGPPLLLLHGNPQTHVMWHKVAPRLARDFSVVATDLRGYGDSSKPPTAPDHAPYSKRAMAADQIAVMRQLGFERFFVAGHDRGGRCAYRMALPSRQRTGQTARPAFPFLCREVDRMGSKARAGHVTAGVLRAGAAEPGPDGAEALAGRR